LADSGKAEKMKKCNKALGIAVLSMGILGTGCENKAPEVVQPKAAVAKTVSAKPVAPAQTKQVETKTSQVSSLDVEYIALEKKKKEMQKMMQDYQGMRSQVGKLYRSGQQDKAEKMITAIKELESKLKPGIESYKKEAKAFSAKLAQGFALSKLEPKYMQMYAQMLGEMGNYRTQVEVLEQVLQKGPFDIKSFMALVNACEQSNQLSKAVQAIQSRLSDTAVSAADKSNLELLLAQNLFFAEKFDEAAELFNRLGKDPAKAPKLASLNGPVMEYKEFWKKEQEYRKNSKDLPVVMIRTNKGNMKFELFEDDAPNAVANFITLAESGFYNGQNFHRVIPKFMAQGGDPLSKDNIPQNDGTGGPGYKIKTDLSKRKHFSGVLSFANSGLDTDGSQFFITVVPTFWLNGKHAVFGRILEGMSVAEGIAKGDEIRSIEVISKRKHKYTVKKI
jgi:cyclophilin family peptidyl-prolyl cis-trans isomerase